MTKKKVEFKDTNPHREKKLNLYAGVDAKEELERLADIASRNRGTRVSMSEIFKRMLENVSDDQVNKWFPGNKTKRRR